jgi:hypothetical protein
MFAEAIYRPPMHLPPVLHMGSSLSGSQQPPGVGKLPTFATPSGSESLPVGSALPFSDNDLQTKAHRPYNQKTCFDKLDNFYLPKMDTIESRPGSKRNSGSVVCSSTTFAQVPSLADVGLLKGPRANSSQEEESNSMFAAGSV